MSADWPETDYFERYLLSLTNLTHGMDNFS
jgi:hypothetical protein